jgi:hypothetical protein
MIKLQSFKSAKQVMRANKAEGKTMQAHGPSDTQVRPNFVLAAPDCPVCKSAMRFVKSAPIPFSVGLVDVSYVCDECGQGTKRTLKET